MFWQQGTHELTDVFDNVESPNNIKLHFQLLVFACDDDEMLGKLSINAVCWILWEHRGWEIKHKWLQ